MNPVRLKKKRLDAALATFILGHDLAVKAGMHRDCSLSAAHEREARRERVRFAKHWRKVMLALFEKQQRGQSATDGNPPTYTHAS